MDVFFEEDAIQLRTLYEQNSKIRHKMCSEELQVNYHEHSRKYGG